MRRHPLRSPNTPRKNSNQTSGATQTSKRGPCGGKGGRMAKVAGEEHSESSSIEWTTELESSLSSSSSACDSYYVREVWANDVEHELRVMEKLVEEYPYIAVDGCFPGVVARPTGPFKNDTERNYEIIRTNMSLVKILQLSLAFSNKNGEVAGHPGDVRRANGSDRPPPACVWKINFHFDVRKDIYCAETLKLLREPTKKGGAGIDLKAHLKRGVSVERFSELITGSGLVLSPDVTWITASGGFLFAGLVKMLSGQALPKAEVEFSEMCYEYFPHIWDMRLIRRGSSRCGMGMSRGGGAPHACASSEKANLEVETPSTLTLLENFFRYDGRSGRMMSSSSDDSSEPPPAVLPFSAMQRRATTTKWWLASGGGGKEIRRKSQFGLEEFSALNLESPASVWQDKGEEVISWRVKLRTEVEAEYEEATSENKEGSADAITTPAMKKEQPNGVVQSPPPPPPGHPPPLEARSTSGSNASPVDRGEEEGPPRYKHPLRHPKYPNGAPPPMCGVISYKGPPPPPIGTRKWLPAPLKRGQPFMHWGCVQLPDVASSHYRRRRERPMGISGGGKDVGIGGHRRGVRS